MRVFLAPEANLPPPACLCLATVNYMRRTNELRREREERGEREREGKGGRGDDCTERRRKRKGMSTQYTGWVCVLNQSLRPLIPMSFLFHGGGLFAKLVLFHFWYPLPQMCTFPALSLSLPLSHVHNANIIKSLRERGERGDTPLYPTTSTDFFGLPSRLKRLSLSQNQFPV